MTWIKTLPGKAIPHHQHANMRSHFNLNTITNSYEQENKS